MNALINEHLTRQSDLIPSDKLGIPITIIGAGAVGSWTALALAKMGCTCIEVWDFDKVDTVNLNSQFYPVSAVGQPKVRALEKLIEDFTGSIGTITTWNKPYTAGTFPGIVITAVDSMAVRKLVWEQHKNVSFPTKVIIDPRMGAEQASLYVMNPMSEQDQISYEKSLYSDEASVQEPCTAKATIYTANLIAGLICKAVKDQIVGKPNYLRTAQWNIAEDELLCFRKANNQ